MVEGSRARTRVSAAPRRAESRRAHPRLQPELLVSRADGFLGSGFPDFGRTPRPLRRLGAEPGSEPLSHPHPAPRRSPPCPSGERLCCPAARLLPFLATLGGAAAPARLPRRRAPNLGPPRGRGGPGRRRAPRAQPHLSPSARQASAPEARAEWTGPRSCPSPRGGGRGEERNPQRGDHVPPHAGGGEDLPRGTSAPARPAQPSPAQRTDNQLPPPSRLNFPSTFV